MVAPRGCDTTVYKEDTPTILLLTSDRAAIEAAIDMLEPVGYPRQRSTQQGFREMLGIEKVDHIGIRVSDKSVSIAFYERLGFKTLSDTGFEKGHPIIMQHPSGVVLNLLGPADTPNDKNILMDTDEKYPGITHVSFKVGSIDAARQFLAGNDIPLSGSVLVQGSASGLHPRPRPQRDRAGCVRRRGTGEPERRRRFDRLSRTSIVEGITAGAR